MTFTVWQFLKNQEEEQERKAREEERQVLAREHQEERGAMRAEREEIMVMLRAEHQRNQELHDRVMEPSDRGHPTRQRRQVQRRRKNGRGEQLLAPLSICVFINAITS